jgi:hypothetical protein
VRWITILGRARGSGTASLVPACSSKVVRSEGGLAAILDGLKLVHGTAADAAAGLATPVAAALMPGFAAFGSTAATSVAGVASFLTGPVNTTTGSPSLTSCRRAADLLAAGRRFERKTA